MGEHDEHIAFEMGYNKGFKDGVKGSIPKADYENRLKADMVAMLEEIQMEIEENQIIAPQDTFYDKKLDGQFNKGIFKASEIIQQKIDKLKENKQ